MKKLVIILSILIYSSVATADEDTPFAMMYLTCFTYNMRHIGEITMGFYQDEAMKVHFNVNTGCFGGGGEGTWNVRNSFFTANFMVNINDEEQEIVFSISGMTILTSMSLLSESTNPNAYFSVLGSGEIIDPECALSEKEKMKFWCFGVCSLDQIRIILH